MLLFDTVSANRAFYILFSSLFYASLSFACFVNPIQKAFLLCVFVCSSTSFISAKLVLPVGERNTTISVPVRRCCFMIKQIVARLVRILTDVFRVYWCMKQDTEQSIKKRKKMVRSLGAVRVFRLAYRPMRAYSGIRNVGCIVKHLIA